MLEDLYKIQSFKIYYKNTKYILTTYFQTFTPHYTTPVNHHRAAKYIEVVGRE